MPIEKDRLSTNEKRSKLRGKVMSVLFSSNRIIETNYKEKKYFSDKSAVAFKIKFYSSLFVFMLFLLGMNIYQSLSEVSVVNTFF